MIKNIKELPDGKKVYFASDFHLGAPNPEKSLEREKKIVRWLNEISKDAFAIFLLGDIFDFWFEYKKAVPKGFTRLLGKLVELSDAGTPIYIFTGNHDMWMHDYFPKELNIPVFKEPLSLTINNKIFFLGHGDGLGPKDYSFKALKKVFSNAVAQWLFARIHPNAGIGIAHMWSKKSRISNVKKDDIYLHEKEWLLLFAKEIEQKKHHDFYIFGHRHLTLDIPVSENSRYINLGEWFNNCSYAIFDGTELRLKYFEKD